MLFFDKGSKSMFVIHYPCSIACILRSQFVHLVVAIHGADPIARNASLQTYEFNGFQLIEDRANKAR